ncbi:MAG: hypothetical protein HN641_06725 [Candidatus Marinimicrobia bacterium]|nr:hypothetical protein [Candidatus Neomarinimicrobiota bacterium]
MINNILITSNLTAILTTISSHPPTSFTSSKYHVFSVVKHPATMMFKRAKTLFAERFYIPLT